ncbi:MAG: DNA polymerase Y family protein [Planctomycetes bacterium]|nr:DNA polymerase Y family protein [Planctomycetota bacterium]
MDRLACVDVRALPLQLLLREEPRWRELPVAVVERDAPGGRVLWLNERARVKGILPGHTHAAALALADELVARPVAPHEIARGTALLCECLDGFSPRVEASADEPGLFWVDVGGLELFHPTLEAWASRVRAALLVLGFESTIAVGFRRQATYAAARAMVHARTWVCPTPEEELRWLARVPLARLDLEPATRDELAKLGVHTLGELARLPSGGLFARYGEAAARWQRVAVGALAGEFAPTELARPERVHTAFEHPLTSVDAVVFAFEELARPVLSDFAARGRAVRSIALRLVLEGAAPKELALAAATPTLDLAEFRRLLVLLLERVALARGVERLELEFADAEARPEELSLFVERPKRDLAAAGRAIAAVRAAFGPDSVVCARLVERHLPEASFEWTPLERAFAPRPRPVTEARLVRRVFAAPLALPPRERHEGDGWLLAGSTRGPVKKLCGPYTLCGGWWKSEVRRDYYFAELAGAGGSEASGDPGAPGCHASQGSRGSEWLWVYYDHARRRWFWHGIVS